MFSIPSLPPLPAKFMWTATLLSIRARRMRRVVSATSFPPNAPRWRTYQTAHMWMCKLILNTKNYIARAYLGMSRPGSALSDSFWIYRRYINKSIYLSIHWPEVVAVVTVPSQNFKFGATYPLKSFTFGLFCEWEWTKNFQLLGRGGCLGKRVDLQI